MALQFTLGLVSRAGSLFSGGKPSQTKVPENMVPPTRDRWYYPPDIANDLQGVDLPWEVKEETFVCTWEYIRCVIPHYTNWPRYVAYMRLIVIGIIAEFRGSLIDISSDENILGYNLNELLDTLFKGTPGHEAMAREYRAFILTTAEKSSTRRDGEFYRRYVNALAQSPRQWFRMRDDDALARFTIATALVCNDVEHVWFSEEQWEILSEIGDTMYDSVAFYKHRSEGEVNSTFAYMPHEMRVQAYHQARETLWALDVAWAQRPELQTVINFLRFFGGPIHMMMRRYRFVDEGLTIGRPETDHVVDQTRKNFKLWNRVDATGQSVKDLERYKSLLACSNKLMYPELAGYLERKESDFCHDCQYRQSYGAKAHLRFGGVEICTECKKVWRSYLESLPERAVAVFPELAGVLRKGRQT